MRTHLIQNKQTNERPWKRVGMLCPHRLTFINKAKYCFSLYFDYSVKLQLIKQKYSSSAGIIKRQNSATAMDKSDHSRFVKSQEGRLSKQEKKRIQYAKRKEKLKEKKVNAKIKLNEKLEEISHEDKLAFSANKKHQRQQKTENAINAMHSGVNVCIDLSFNDVNSPREQRSLVKQCTLSYAAIRKSAHGVALHISSLQGDLGAALGEQGASQWHVHQHEASAFDVFDRDTIVVLSPDADEILQDIDSSKVYIIGGIIDRTVRSNLTLDLASVQGVASRRLPVKEFFPQAQSHVINIDQVVSLFCHFQETKDWQASTSFSLSDCYLIFVHCFII